MFCSALWLYKILVVNGAANCGRKEDSLKHGEHMYLYMASKYLTVVLISKTTFSGAAVKELIIS